MNNIIEVEQLSFSYGHVPALQKVSLQVPRGEFLGIVGPNAGGKSTLLKLLLGLLKPQAGQIRILGKKPQTSCKSIGYVPQYPSFARDFPITVEEVVMMGRLGKQRLFGGYCHTDRAATAQALAEVEATTLAKRPIGALSGGQLQRVLLARALVSQPEILILDEPTANIDMRMENDIFDQLKVLNERMTILVVSHDIAFISNYVHRVACLNRTLVCHHTDSIDGDVIQQLYGDNVSMIAHSH